MGILVIQDIRATQKQVRKIMKPQNITVRVYPKDPKAFIIFPKANYRYTKTAKQLECRDRFRKAQMLMMEDFKRPEQVEYWQNAAKELGYKTAKGCARAYYMRLLKGKEELEVRDGKGKWSIAEKSTEDAKGPLFIRDYTETLVSEGYSLFDFGPSKDFSTWERSKIPK